jgi:chromosome partitioning protein
MTMSATITVIGGQKGGTGKSNLAGNLAARLARDGARVVIVDTDMSQNTSDAWQAMRATNDALPFVECEIQVCDDDDRNGAKMAGALDALAARFDHVLIDTGGADSSELRVALTKAHWFVSPVKPAPADMWTLKKIHALLLAARRFNPALRAKVVLSIAPTNPKRGEAKAAQTFIARFPELELCRAVIRDRAAYLRAYGQGRGVIEYAPTDVAAIAEINQLASEIFEHA